MIWEDSQTSIGDQQTNHGIDPVDPVDPNGAVVFLQRRESVGYISIKLVLDVMVIWIKPALPGFQLGLQLFYPIWPADPERTLQWFYFLRRRSPGKPISHLRWEKEKNLPPWSFRLQALPHDIIFLISKPIVYNMCMYILYIYNYIYIYIHYINYIISLCLLLKTHWIPNFDGETCQLVASIAIKSILWCVVSTPLKKIDSSIGVLGTGTKYYMFYMIDILYILDKLYILDIFCILHIFYLHIYIIIYENVHLDHHPICL